jgi:hypothetical protein
MAKILYFLMQEVYKPEQVQTIKSVKILKGLESFNNDLLLAVCDRYCLGKAVT